MSIKWGENPSNPLTHDQYDMLAYQQQHDYSVTIARRRPEFSEHSLLTNTTSDNINFDVFACHDRIVRVWTDGGHLYSQVLMSESDDQSAALNTWSSAYDVDSSEVFFKNAPSLVGYITSGTNVTWKVAAIYSTMTVSGIDLSDAIKVYHSTDGMTWTEDTSYSSAILNMGSDHHVQRPTYWEYASVMHSCAIVTGPVEIVYYWAVNAMHNEHLFYIYQGEIYETDIAYPFEITGFDAQVINDPSFDNLPSTGLGSTEFDNGYLSNVTTRHVLTVSTKTPPTYTYNLVNNVPVPVSQPSGGIISWCVIPPQHSTSSMTNPPPYIHFGTHDIVEIFQPLTPQVSRLYPRINTSASYFDPIHNYDTIYCTALMRDGDNNQTDTSFSYQYIGYYTSRDGIHWSQTEPIIDVTDSTPGTAQYSLAGGSGCLVRLGHYLYLVSINGAMRSPVPIQFTDPHPDWVLDISTRVMDMSRELSDMSQSRITIDNRDGYFWNTFLLQNPAAFDLITAIGNSTYKQIVSIEQVDNVQPSLQQPNQSIDISTRGAKANMTDRFKANNAILHDNAVTRIDTFAPTGGIINSGMGHVAVQSGSWSSDLDSKLHIVSNQLGTGAVEFSSFKDMIENGIVEVGISFANDPVLGGATGNTAGIVFRGLDKANWMGVGFDTTNGGFFLFISNNNTPGFTPLGTLMPYVPPTGTAPSGYPWSFPPLSDIRTGSFFGMRVEFLYNLIRIYIFDPYGNYYELAQCESYGIAANPDAVAVEQVLLTTGYVGLWGETYSSDDTGSTDTPPSYNLIGNSICGTGQTTFHVTNTGATATPSGTTYTVKDSTETVVVSGSVSLSAGASMDIIAVAIGTLTLIIEAP